MVSQHAPVSAAACARLARRGGKHRAGARREGSRRGACGRTCRGVDAGEHARVARSMPVTPRVTDPVELCVAALSAQEAGRIEDAVAGFAAALAGSPNTL